MSIFGSVICLLFAFQFQADAAPAIIISRPASLSVFFTLTIHFISTVWLLNMHYLLHVIQSEVDAVAKTEKSKNIYLLVQSALL